MYIIPCRAVRMSPSRTSVTTYNATTSPSLAGLPTVVCDTLGKKIADRRKQQTTDICDYVNGLSPNTAFGLEMPMYRLHGAIVAATDRRNRSELRSPRRQSPRINGLLSPVHTEKCDNLSPKTATVAEKCDSRRISPLSRRFRRQSHFSATFWTGL